MDRFRPIPQAAAIIRMKSGVLKEVKVYCRKTRVFVRHGGGFIEILSKLGDRFDTSNLNVKVIDYEIPGAEFISECGKRLRYTREL